MTPGETENMASDTFQRPMTAQEAVHRELRRNILSSRWEPGTPIRQDAVAAELGVSRVPVREALKILEGEGQIAYEPHKGYIVRELSATELEEIYRLRELLEAEAIRNAVPKLTDDDLAEMQDAMVALEALESTDIISLSEENRRFHAALFRAADMPRLQHFVRLLRDWADVYRALLYSDVASLEKTCEEHREIYAACVAGDVERVVTIHQEHRGHTVDALRPVLVATEDDAAPA
jgi:DNA-binding GntR family transcriptional regulator